MSNLQTVEKNNMASVQNEQVMHPLVSAAMGAGTELTPENLSKLLDVQKEWEANEARKAYSQAMVQFREICPSILKDADVSYGNTSYSHETLDGMLKTISPALSECGINPTFRTGVGEGGIIIVTCRVTHKDGHFEETSIPAMADNSGKKNSIQAIGSTLTYLQRYTLKAILGLSAGFDDDALSSTEELIDDQQHLELSAKIDETKADKKRFLQFWKISNLSELYASNFDLAIKSLNDACAARAAK